MNNPTFETPHPLRPPE